MPINRVPDVYTELANALNLARRRSQVDPIFLNGYSGANGGTGGAIGGFIGKLIQTAVTYDTSEAATLTTSSTPSLLDNLNHIRARLPSVSNEDLVERVWCGW
jgi:hypothetical protein